MTVPEESRKRHAMPCRHEREPLLTRGWNANPFTVPDQWRVEGCGVALMILVRRPPADRRGESSFVHIGRLLQGSAVPV